MSNIEQYLAELNEKQAGFFIIVAEKPENEDAPIQLRVETNLTEVPDLGMYLLQSTADFVYDNEEDDDEGN